MTLTTTTKPTRALARGLEVIRVLNERRSTPIGLLSERTHLSRATLLRVLNTLDAAGWIYRYRIDGHYRLSSEVCRLGQHLLTADRLVESAAPILDRLYGEVGWPSDLAVRTGQGMLILESTRRAHPEIGNHHPLDVHMPMLWSAPGRAYLAFCPAAEREAILDGLRDCHERQDQAIHDRWWVEDLLANTRARGYGAIEPSGRDRRLNGKRSLGAMAVPVKADGQIRACLSLVWIERDDTPGRVSSEWLLALQTAAQEIAHRLHFREAADAP